MQTAAMPQMTLVGAVVRYVELLYTAVILNIRRNSLGSLGLLSSFMMPIGMLLLFLLMYSFLGRPMAIRGDFVTFLLTGIYLFLLCIRTKGACNIAGAGSLAYHQPIQPILMCWAGGLSMLYIMTASMILIFIGNFLYHGVFELQNPYGMIAPFLVTWLFGVASGMVITGVCFYTGGKQFANIMFQRAMFITSGKFFVASSIPASLRPFFDWNPIFHTIDQMRGATFVNYNADTTTMTYPIIVVAVMLLFGHMMERRIRRDFSLSSK